MGYRSLVQGVLKRFSLPVLTALSLSWLVASNHCALSAIAASHVEGARACCHKSPERAKLCEEACCARLAAPVPLAKDVLSPAQALIAILPPDGPAHIAAAGPVKTVAGPSPPGAGHLFFVEFIAGAIHPSLAPPVVVVA